MKRIRYLLLGVVLALALIALIGPLLVPIPPLDGVVPPRQLAEEDSLFLDVNGLDVHLKRSGDGKPVMILLHGFLASTFTWREVLDPLGELGTVVAFDRPAFGLTERPSLGDWPGENPYTPEAQAALTVGLMDALGIDQAVLIGNSAGGAIAALTALEYPDRVAGLVLVDAAIFSGGGTPPWIQPVLRAPQLRRLGPFLVRSIRGWGEGFGRSAWFDPSRFTPEMAKGFLRPLSAQNWDQALWDFTLASRPVGIPERLDELTLPVLVITGEEDQTVPAEESIRLAEELPDARLLVIPACGHVPQVECPGPVLEAVEAFLADLR